jgi:hypothetical protein
MAADRNPNSAGREGAGAGGSARFESWQDMRRRLGRDMTVALVGFPNSGKTSYLYALKSIPRPVRHSRWRISGVSAEFASLTGSSGVPQMATVAGHLDFARFCRVIRPVLNVGFLGWVLGRARWVTTAEVSGETLQAISEGKPDDDGSSSEFLEFLGHSTVIIGFASLDGLRGSRGVGAIGDPDQALLGSLKAIERILESAATRRPAGAHPLVMSLLVTKADLLAESPGLDQIDLSDSRSTVRALALARGGPLAQWLEAAGSGGGRVRYRLSDLLGHEHARDDLEMNEAMAADFLKCHAPKSAMQIAAMQSDRVLDASIRVFMCSPYGTAVSDDRGGDKFPRADQMHPLLVHEPLEDALERAWAHSEGRRRRRHAMIAFAAVLALVITLPATRWTLGARADAALERARETGSFESWVRAREAVRTLERSPEVALHRAIPAMRWLSPRVQVQHAWRLRACAELALDHAPDEAAVLAMQALALAPEDPDAMAVTTQVYVRRIVAYLDGRADGLPRHAIELDTTGVNMLIRQLDQITKSSRGFSASEREALAARLHEVRAHAAVSSRSEPLVAAIDSCMAAASGADPVAAGAAVTAATAVDVPLRRGDLPAARQGCDETVAALVAQWSHISPGHESWPKGPAWLEPVRAGRESAALRRFALERQRTLDALLARMAESRGQVDEREVADCMQVLKDLLWARDRVAGSSSDEPDHLVRTSAEVAVSRDTLLAGLQSAQPWPRDSIAGIADSFRSQDAGPLQVLLAAQRALLARRLQDLASHLEREGDEAHWRELVAAMRESRVADDAALGAMNDRFFACRAARTSPLDVAAVERHLRDFITHGPDAGARLSLAQAVIDAVASKCCTSSAKDLVHVVDAASLLGMGRSEAAGTLLSESQKCFESRADRSDRAQVAEQSARLGQLLQASGMHWRDGLRQSIERLGACVQSARSGDDLAPGTAFGGLLRALEGIDGLVGDAQFQALVKACARHAELIRHWRLVRLPAPAARGGRGGYWLSQYEWSRRRDVASVLRDCSRAELEQAVRGPLKGMVVQTPNGFAWAPLTGRERLEMLEANLGIADAKAAEALVGLVGLRLPTMAELDAARDRPRSLSEDGRKKMVAQRERFLTPESLDEADRTEDGIVGLNSGVCEWTSQGLWGRTHMTSTSDDNIRPYVQGVRPALDLIPRELQQALAR